MTLLCNSLDNRIIGYNKFEQGSVSSMRIMLIASDTAAPEMTAVPVAPANGSNNQQSRLRH